MTLFTGQVVIDRKLRRWRTDGIGCAGAKQHGAFDHRGKVLGIEVRQLGIGFVDTSRVLVKPARPIAQALVGNVVGIQIPDQAEIRQEGIEDGGAIDKLAVKCTGRNAQTAALRRAVHKHTGKIDALELANDAAQDANILVQADIVEIGRVAVDTGNDMPGNRRAFKSTNILGGTSLAGAVEGDECHAHARKRRLLKPAAACTRIPMELKYQWHGLVRDGFKVLGMQASATHAGIPEVEKLAGRGIGDRCRLDRIVKPDGVGLGHAILPKEIEI